MEAVLFVTCLPADNNYSQICSILLDNSDNTIVAEGSAHLPLGVIAAELGWQAGRLAPSAGEPAGTEVHQRAHGLDIAIDSVGICQGAVRRAGGARNSTSITGLCLKLGSLSQ